MPDPSVEPTPLPFSELRFGAPADAQEASYLAASDRMASLERRLRRDMPPAYCSLFVLSSGIDGKAPPTDRWRSGGVLTLGVDQRGFLAVVVLGRVGEAVVHHPDRGGEDD